jgi:hypothetical protein
MTRWATVARAFTGLSALLITLHSLIALGRSPETHVSYDAGRGKGRQRSGSSDGSKHWVVMVDGWSFRFDRAAPRPSSLDVLQDDVGRNETADIEPSYQALIVKYATEAGLDWRFVAALIVEESRSSPEGENAEGACGPLQLGESENAVCQVGEGRDHDPEANIRVEVGYLAELARVFEDSNGLDRLALMLAAYHMGRGHLSDAQSLAVRFEYDPLRWFDSLERVVPLLEQPPMYRDLDHGYARGRQTVQFVDRVLQRYARYCRKKRSEPPG